MRIRHVGLVGALVAFVISIAAVATLVAGRKWLWFGAGTAGVLLGVHVVAHYTALGLGGASAFGYVRRWLHRGAGEGPATQGKVLHSAFWYDVLVWIVTRGKERAFRDGMIDAARIEPGQSVLDVGCGTGALAIAAKRRVGAGGRVCGIDASSEMIARAREKARKAGLEVSFEAGVIESLPFADGTFDVVTATIMLHHLPEDVRRLGLREIRRVLKPGGRLFVVDFGGDAHGRHGWAHRRHHRDFDIRKVIPEVSDAGMRDLENGPLGFRDLQFIRAAAP
jgi:ubiquinone/menaquinone biosynthesis C-methylase UbiE